MKTVSVLLLLFLSACSPKHELSIEEEIQQIYDQQVPLREMPPRLYEAGEKVWL